MTIRARHGWERTGDSELRDIASDSRSILLCSKVAARIFDRPGVLLAHLAGLELIAAGFDPATADSSDRCRIGKTSERRALYRAPDSSGQSNETTRSMFFVIGHEDVASFPTEGLARRLFRGARQHA